MKKWYHIVKGALDQSQCAELVAYASTHEQVQASVGHGSENRKDQNLRVSSIRWLKRSDDTLSPLYSIISAETHRANANYFGADIRSFGDVQYTEYPATKKSHYGWHQDMNWTPANDAYTPYDRKLSVCIQLSPKDNYKGGEFWVNPRTETMVEDFSEVGDMIIFPSHLWHKVDPVTKGCRVSLVAWWMGPRWK